MLGVQAISERFGLTPKQVRDRLTALAPVLDGCLITGKQNAKLVTDEGLALFDRLIQLEREGITTATAVRIIAEERPQADKAPVKLSESDGSTERIIRLLEDRIAGMERDKLYLQAKLDEVLSKVPALTAGPDCGGLRIGWLRALRIALLGQ